MRGLATAVVTMFAVIGAIATLHELRGQEKAPLQGATFRHIGVVVKDIDATLKVFSEVFGVPGTTVATTEVPVPESRTVSIKYAFLNLGGVRVEVIQPMNGPGPHYDYLQKFGPSLQHVAFAIPNVPQAVKTLQARGGTWTLGKEGVPFAYVDMKEQLGMTIELNTAR